MSKPGIKKVFPLTGEAFELAKEYAAVFNAAREEQKSLQAEYEKAQEQVFNANMTKLREIWTKMAVSVGIDAESTWSNPAWGFERSYIESGFAAILEMEPPQNPLAALFGGEGPVMEQEEAPVIDKSKLN